MTESRTKNGILIAVLIVLVAVLAVVAVLFIMNCKLIEWQVYPRDAQVLNLRGDDISVDHYKKVRREFPHAKIYWDVPIGDSRYPENTTELTITEISDEVISLLGYLDQLQTVHAEDCEDYALLAKLQDTYPDCRVHYSVTVDGKDYDRDAAEIEVSALTDTDVARLTYLPELKTVHADACKDYAQLAAIREQYPDCQVNYSVTIAGQDFSMDSQEITVSGADAVQLEALLPYLPQVNTVHLIDPVSDGQSLMQLRQNREDIAFSWEMDFFGIRVSSSDTEIDISGTLPESLDQVAAMMECLPNAEKLIMTDCGFANEDMAAFRESKREDYKVVWTVMCGTIPVRTDEIFFHPIQERVYYFFDEDAYNLRYCEDMICVDVGHMALHDISWVEYMPNLKYLILCLTTVIDISPLSTCKNLIFLELDMTGIKDYTPLLGCTSLEDLNLGMTYGDPAPIAQMTWLKNLWWKDKGYETRIMLEEALPNTNMNFNPKATSGGGWRKLQNYYDMRDILGMPYMD